MNKLLSVTLMLASLSVCCSVYANSTINIPIPANNIIVANSEIELPLGSLTNDVPYLVTCILDSASPTQLDMSFSPRLAPNGGFGVAKLNGKPILKNTGTLHTGQNTFSFMASISTKNKAISNVLILKNLDDRFSASLKTCQAQPVSNVTAAAKRMGGGYFFVTNHLPFFLDITVGSYFPTSYCIYPYSKQYIEASTSYQDIDIIGTHF